MKAVTLNGAGGAEVMRYADVPEPVAGPGHVMVEVAAAGVNFMDIGARRGLVGGGYKPTILGVEGAGRVLDVGPGVVDFRVGDRVAWVFAPSSYAERVAVPADSLVRVPDDIADVTAASLMMQGLTASHFATDFYPVKPGDVALVHAAAGGLGQILSQIIKLRGGTVIGRVSSAAKIDTAKAAGADHVIVDGEGRFADQVRQLTGGVGVDVVYDGSGPVTFQGSLDALRRSGTFCWYGPVLGEPSAFNLMSLPRSVKIGYAVFFDHIPTPELLRERAARLFGWVRDGKLQLTPATTFGLADAAVAHAKMESRATTGKLLLIP
ncbi:quinone oxidoreductase [Sphingomonas sp. H39-1-10]|uniref:quinone oxidoreductase family protein n=1 Tax=Sphingomonas pollutisoli TaxID=3030829 RepID=UPI0023B8DB55|nr:quinone oxidoreductase [Sphingomonas pollutisoli]MDF0486729.1 quinone oxidoreductase [Sphingomonas pollutisoli]